ncbi:MAG TPA: undecaprenyldiphospho-muramoylpentapeptide beta-N-acetylglucosaminyltransferase [Bacillales bacterium]|nr:undecaprenyldiphospho-muramoylpentapeptide beta-N-acetylglucosaminyltransferase [Bacillales bacterium]
MEKRILFTGGGTAGHVIVNLALIPEFLKQGWEVAYVGSETGIERELVGKLSGVDYYAISTGKLRRYFDWNNFKDPFKVMKGVVQSYRIIRRIKPSVIFSKGGFVSVPVVLGARLNRVPTVIHESDLTPGLANKLAIPFATKVCTTFPETAQHLPAGKVQHIGAVIREELKLGNANRGLALCGFTKHKPVMLIMGGSLGSRAINESVRDQLDVLLEKYQVVHLCGKGNVIPSMERHGYRQFEYVDKELPDLLALADFIVSRAGANAIFEFLSLRKPMLLIPLPAASSRGDQILNARSFEKAGFCEVLPEEHLTSETFVTKVNEVYEHRAYYLKNMDRSDRTATIEDVIALLKETARSSRV